MPRVLLLLVALALGAAPGLRAQSDQCNTVDLPDVEEQYEGAGEMLYVRGPFLVRCVSGAELRADSGTLNRLTRELLLVGRVDYRDAERTLTADQATYSSVTRRLYATGNVVFTDRVQGTTIRGPELEYYATGANRPEAQVNAGRRPHLTLMPRDTARSDEPLEIDADDMTIVGSDDLTARGSVVITRPDLTATASEARYDGAAESLALREDAVVMGGENVLRGRFIDAQLENDALKEVHSREGAVLEAKDMRVTAADVRLFFREELVERTIARADTAFPGERPVAVTKTFRLVADSIEAVAPGQELERVIAVGDARGETIDTLRAMPAPESAPDVAPDTAAAPTEPAAASSLVESDWIAGDTIIGYFERADSAAAAESTEPGDTSVTLKRIVARGAAKSLYRMDRDSTAAESSSAPARKGVNFVSA
jgi:lipopolysaccharide export system protein LptA